MKKILFFLLAALLAFGVGWAEDLTYTFTSASAGTLSGAPSGVSASFTSANNGYPSDRGIQLTKNNGTLTLTISGFTSSYKLTGISLIYSTNKSSGAGTVTATLGTSQLATFSPTTTGGTTDRTGTLSVSETAFNGNNLVLAVNVTTNSVYVKSFTVSYAQNGGGTTPTCEAPVFSPEGGTYTSAQTVTLTSATSGATIYYTTDGTNPTTSSNSVSNGGTVTVSSSCTLKAMATAGGYNNSDVTEATYTINAGGGGSSCDAFIEFKDNGSDSNTAFSQSSAVIQYMTAGSDYVTSVSDFSSVYPGETGIKFGTSSKTGSITFNLASQSDGWKVTKIILNAAKYSSDTGSLKVTTSANSTGVSKQPSSTNFADYEFAFDGSEITSFTIATTQKRAYVKSITLVYDCTPSTDPWVKTSESSLTLTDIPVGGSSTSGTFTVTGDNLTGNVTLTCDNSDFTVSPSSITPANGSVEQAITVTYTGTSTTAVTATITVASNGATSKTVTVTAKKTAPTAPVIDTATGTYYNDLMPVITAQTGCTLRYTVDGVEYTVNDNEEIINIPYGTGSTVVTATALDGDNASATTTVTYTWGTATVTLTPADGSTFTGSTVNGTITATPSDATIEWSTDGGQTWTTYNNGFTATVNSIGGTATVTARATKGKAIATATATYTREALPTPDAPTFSRQGSEVKAGTTVTITAPEGCTLYVNGEAVTSPCTVTINNAQTIEAYCVNDEGTRSATVSNRYTIKPAGSDEFELVTSTDDVTIDDDYVLVYSTASNNHAMSNSFNSSNYYSTVTSGFELANSVVTLDDPTTVNVLTLQDAGSGQFYIVDEDGYYLYYNSGNTVNRSATLGTTNAYKWNITINSSGAAEIQNVGTTSRYLQCNYSSNRYACYQTTSNQYNAMLYKRGTLRVAAPEIVPATGTYYESQTVTMTCETEGATIYYTTDGSDPSTTNGTIYVDPFELTYHAGETQNVKAIAVDEQGNMSDVTEVVYTWARPAVVINPDSRNTTASSVNVTLTGTPAGAVIYYTTNGSEPTATSGTRYDGTFTVELSEIGDAVTVKAIAVYNGTASEVATATYTRMEKVIDVNAPFFSPMANYTYYGDQTLQLGCTTPGADIYYEIVEVSGSTAPAAGTVADPTKASAYYEGTTTINMTVGNSYRVRAIAYVGNFASTISEAWYTVLPTSEWTNHTGATTILENVAELRSVTSGSKVCFRNPVQVVYMSKFVNDDAPLTYNNPIPEYVYVRDNTGYGVVYFGKGTTDWAKSTSGLTNSPAKHFEMGDWIDGSWICGTTGTWDNGLIPQVGTGAKTITSWPASSNKNVPIIAEETTCAQISAGTKTDNLCGHYLHLRYSTMSDVKDYNSNDPRHSGTITDLSGTCTYYDRFWLYSGSGQSYTYSSNTYTLKGVGHYDQDFFDSYQNKGATFDVFCVGDYYSDIAIPYEIYPIDFLWIYKPVVSVPTGTYYGKQTVEITVDQPEWTTTKPTIYYKTDDMDDWAEYTGPIVVNSDTRLQTYAEVPATKTDGTSYNDMVRSLTVDEIYEFEGVEDPSIDPASRVVEIVTGDEKVTVTVMDNNTNENAVTVYTTDGTDPRTSETRVVLDVITEWDVNISTTVSAVSYLVVAEGDTLWSNVVTETYTFVKKNGVIYDIVKEAPVVGNVYVLVNKAAQMGMSTTQNATNRGSVGVMFTDDSKDHVYGNDELAQFVLEQATGGRYYFKAINGDATGYLQVTTNAAANLTTGAVAGSDAEARVSVENGGGYPATIVFSHDGTSRYLRYYANGRFFSTYGDGSLNEDVYLYGVEATPLAYIESSKQQGNQVTVSDQLIGAWAVVNTTTGEKLLWAKDQGQVSIDKRPAKTDAQADYLREHLNYQHPEWDESNWVILDFSGIAANPEDFVNRKLASASITGRYSNSVNYTITLTGEAPVDAGAAEGYKGFDGPISKLGASYDLAYNTYVPANFMTENQNRLNAAGEVVGFVADDTALGNFKGDELYFINPKIEEVARVWAVWSAEATDKFTVYRCSNEGGSNINAWNVSGAFNVDWRYNRKSEQQSDYGRPNGLEKDVAYEFHAAIMRPATASLKAVAQGTAKTGDATPDYLIYPLDLPDGGTPTAVTEVAGGKQVESVSYYNLTGVKSDRPHEGINIVVTRYSDGSSTAVKVLR